MKTLRILALAIATTFVLSALAAGSAIASEFEAEDFPAEINGASTGEHVFGLEDGLSVKCKAATFEGEIEEWSEAEELSASYSECTASGVAATVAMNGCTYNFHAGAEMVEEGDFEGTVDLKCPAGKTIVVVAGTCEVQIGAQSGLGNVEYDDNPEATPDNVTVTPSLTKIKYTKAIDGILCPLTGTGAKEDGTYSGPTLITGEVLEESTTGVAVGAPKTKICAEEPKPTCKSQLKKGTKIEAKAEEAEYQIGFTFRETKKGVQKLAVLCGVTKFSMETDADEGNPHIQLKEMTMTFSKCETEVKKTACTVTMKGAPGFGGLRWHSFFPYSGYLRFGDTFAFECKGEFICEYTAPRTGFPPLFPNLYGGSKPYFQFGEWLDLSNQTENCYSVGDISGSMKIVEPKNGIWVLPK